MGKSILLACETIKDEILDVIRELRCSIPTVFVESSLHNDPVKLNRRLTREISRIRNVEHILLGYGFCGNAVCGIRSFDKTLVLPRVDDCITLLLGSMEKRREINKQRAYYLTRGMLNNKENIWVEYRRFIDKYGREIGVRLMKETLDHYKKIVVIETPSGKPDNWQTKVDELCLNLGLDKVTIQGTYTLIRKILTGVWDSNFVVIRPGEKIRMEMLFDPFIPGCHGCSRNINQIV